MSPQGAPPVTVHALDLDPMASRPYGRRDSDSPRARDLRKRMAANRRRRERLEAELEQLRTAAAELAEEARGELTYDAMADALGLSRSMVGYLLQPTVAAAPARAAG